MEIIVLLFGLIIAIGLGFWLLLFGIVFVIEAIWFVLMLPIRLVGLIGVIFGAVFSFLAFRFTGTGHRARSLALPEAPDQASGAEALGRAVGRRFRTGRNFARALIWRLPI